MIRTHNWAQVGAVIPGAAYFTLLRDPIRRFVSLYSYSLDCGHAQLDLNAGLNDWCDMGYPDFQANWLGTLGGPVQFSLLPWGRNPHYVEVDGGGMRITETVMTFAEQALDRFFFVGMTDHFDESLCLAALLMRSPVVGRWALLNTSSASSGFVLDDRVRARLEYHFAPELAFYERQRHRFHERFGEELRFLKAHLPSLRR